MLTLHGLNQPKKLSVRTLIFAAAAAAAAVFLDRRQRDAPQYYMHSPSLSLTIFQAVLFARKVILRRLAAESKGLPLPKLGQL